MKEELLVVWTSCDPDVAIRMVLMYTGNAKKRGWWDRITLLLWGPSQVLLTGSDAVQERLAEILNLGVRVVACKACADSYPVTEELEAIGVEVFYTGELLTEWIKSSRPLLTF